MKMRRSGWQERGLDVVGNKSVRIVRTVDCKKDMENK